MKLRRAVPLALAGGLLLTLGSMAEPASAAPEFNPVMTASRTTDAARAATALHVDISQPDGQHQVGKLRIALPRTYTFATDVPGSNGAQIGTAKLTAYIDPRPSTLTIDATVHDDNAGCAAGRQCVLVKATIPGIGEVELPLEIAQTATEYVIEGDISGLWNDDYVRGIDARLKQLIVDIAATAGTHTVFANPPVAGDHPFTYAFTSARINDLGHPGGLLPDCGAVCPIALDAKEYAPSAPGPRVPGSLTGSDTVTTFAWAPAVDANRDAVTYTLDVAGPSGFTQTLTGLSVTIGTLAPGDYTWTVTATDATGRVASSPVRALRVVDVDGAGALRFTSAANSDVLLIEPGVGLVYRVRGEKTSWSELSGRVALPADRGLIRYQGAGFSLSGAYDAATGSAALVLNQSGTNRAFLDPAV